MSPAVSALIHLGRFRENLAAFRRRIPAGTPLCPAVKANAYGHGIALLLPVLQEAGVEALCVAQLEEALELRALGWTRRVLCLGAPLIGENEADNLERAIAAIESDIEVTVTSCDELETITKSVRTPDRLARVQVKVDTGMGRMGVPAAQAAELIDRAQRVPGIMLAGVYTHFATADETDLDFAREQLANLTSLARLLPGRLPEHAANSAAVLRLPEAALDMVRPGLGVYGYWGGPATDRPADLQPIMRVVSRIVAVKHIPAGSSVGYGRSFRAQKDSTIGVVPIGYADGYRRALSNCGVITLDARRDAPRVRVPVVGRVSMDQISVDLTAAGEVRPGDAVTILDDLPDACNSVEAVARQIGTIPYEITCGLGPRIRRVAVEG
jgi:alanine racemase